VRFAVVAGGIGAVAIAGYIRSRNVRAQPKCNFAPDSVIRTWTDYKINVA
jgi:hypothetical protein